LDHCPAKDWDTGVENVIVLEPFTTATVRDSFGFRTRVEGASDLAHVQGEPSSILNSFPPDKIAL